jgi:hypothetical protein
MLDQPYGKSFLNHKLQIHYEKSQKEHKAKKKKKSFPYNKLGALDVRIQLQFTILKLCLINPKSKLQL